MRHRQAHRLRKLVDRFRECQPRMLDQKADRRSMRAATEAVIELLSRTNRKRRALLVVERAKPHEVRAAFLELHIPPHHVDDIDAVEQVLQERVRNHDTCVAFKRTGAPSAGCVGHAF